MLPSILNDDDNGGICGSYAQEFVARTGLRGIDRKERKNRD